MRIEFQIAQGEARGSKEEEKGSYKCLATSELG